MLVQRPETDSGKPTVDPFTGDEMISDAYPSKMNEEAGMLEFTGRWIEIQDDEEDPNSKHQVIDIVNNQNLQPLSLKASQFMGWAKQFCPKRKTQLESENPSLVATFMANAKKAMSFIGKNIKNVDFYTGSSCDPDAMLVFCIVDDDNVPHVYLLAEGCNSEKC